MQPIAKLSLLLAAVLPLATAAPTTQARAAGDWSGSGRLVPIDAFSGETQPGCLTAEGQWTGDEAQCAIFTAVRGESQSILLSTSAGPCGIVQPTFKCGADVKPTVFGTWPNGVPATTKEVLRYSQYGVFADRDDQGPPTPGGKNLDLSFYSGSEPGPFVWLSWESA
ncbi:hypothetical protein VTK26DRAFT_7190 [Humicola hyalothermophila]